MKVLVLCFLRLEIKFGRLRIKLSSKYAGFLTNDAKRNSPKVSLRWLHPQLVPKSFILIYELFKIIKFEISKILLFRLLLWIVPNNDGRD